MIHLLPWREKRRACAQRGEVEKAGDAVVADRRVWGKVKGVSALD